MSINNFHFRTPKLDNQNYTRFRQQRRRGKNRRARKGLRRNVDGKRVTRPMLKSLETKRRRRRYRGLNGGSLIPQVARSRQSRNRQKERDVVNDDNNKEGNI